MFTGPLVASRRAREAEELAVAAAAASAPGSPRSPRRGGSPRAAASPSSYPPSPRGAPPRTPPPRRERTAAAGMLATQATATSVTEAPLLDELLPLLEPSARGRSMGTAGCAISLAKATLGVGVVALPRVFLLLGALPAAAACAAVAALSFASCRALALGTRHTGQATYSGVLAAQLGASAAAALDAAMAASCWGAQAVYFVAAGDALQLRGGAPSLRGGLRAALASRAVALPALGLLVVAPLVSFRRLHRTSAASALGVAAVAAWACAALYLAGVRALKGEVQPLSPWPDAELLAGKPWPQAALELAAALNIILCAFLCQHAFLPVVRELELPAPPRRMARAAGGAMALALALMLLLACASEAAFGRELNQDVLRNFTVEGIRSLLHERHAGLATALAFGVRGAYLLSILSCFPLEMQPMRESLARLRHPHTSYYSLQAAELGGGAGWQFYAVTYAALAGACALAVVAPSIWEPLELLGATAGAAIAFVLPGALAASMAGWRLRGGGGGGGGEGGPLAPPSVSAEGGTARTGLLLMLAGLLLAVAGITKAVLA